MGIKDLQLKWLQDQAKNDCNIPEIERSEEQMPSGQVGKADVKIYFHPADKIYFYLAAKIFLFRKNTWIFKCHTKRENTLLSNKTNKIKYQQLYIFQQEKIVNFFGRILYV